MNINGIKVGLDPEVGGSLLQFQGSNLQLAGLVLDRE
jgi:hypothetical protein